MTTDDFSKAIHEAGHAVIAHVPGERTEYEAPLSPSRRPPALPAGDHPQRPAAFSTAGAGVKTNLLFFTKGKKTETIWYYDLTHVKVGKKTPLTLSHFGFGKDGNVLPDGQLPANLVPDWRANETNAGKPFPSYARLLAHRAAPEANSRYS